MVKATKRHWIFRSYHDILDRKKIHLPEGTEDQVRYLLSQKGVDALLVAAIGMALGALVVAASAVGLHSSAQLAQRILAAIGFMGLSTLALWAGMALKGTRDEAGSRVPVPVPVRVRARVRPRR